MTESDLFSLAAYDYELPPERIAQAPVEPRDHSRLLVVDRARSTLTHRRFLDLPDYLDASDLLVANNTRVMKARLLGHRLLSKSDEAPVFGGKIEMLLLGALPGGFWEGAFKSTARQSPGLRFAVPKPSGGYLVGEIVRGASESKTGTVVARFDEDPLASDAGSLPLPHYINRKGPGDAEGRPGRSAPTSADESAYQTVYAKATGSAAAPTAGLHFTPAVIDAIRTRGARWSEVTLHVGLGTFRPVKTDDIRAHAMHEERFEVPEIVAQEVTAHRQAGGRVVCIGTTAVRTLESVYDAEAKVYRSGMGSTSIFLHPGGRSPEAFDRLLTNFHLPKSTLLMLACAFGGRELILHAYREAVREKYRFFSYGDAMLIL